jgi:hypothetical protein
MWRELPPGEDGALLGFGVRCHVGELEVVSPSARHDTNIRMGRGVQGTCAIWAGYRVTTWGRRRRGGQEDAWRTTWNSSRPGWCVTTGRTGDRERSPWAPGLVSATSVGQLSTTASASTEFSAAFPARWWSTAGTACVALGARWSGCSASRCRRSHCVDTGRR